MQSGEDRAWRATSRLGTAWIGGVAALIAITWGLCFVLIQASLPSPTPLLLAGMRALIGGGVLVVWIARRGDSRRARLRVPRLPLLSVLALSNAALAFGAMYLAAGRAEAAVASILVGGQPLVLTAAGWLLFAEYLSPRAFVGLAVAMLGVVLVAASSSAATSLQGVALALLAAVAPAAGTILMRRIGSGVDLLATTSAQFLAGGAMLVIASALFEPWAQVSWSSAALGSLLILGVVGTGLAYVGWFWLLERISLVRLGAVLFLVPVIGVLSGILAGNRPTLPDLAGIAALLVGIALVSATGTGSAS